MCDRARDWSERGRRARVCASRALQSLNYCGLEKKGTASNPSACLSVCLSVRPSLCLSVCLPVGLSRQHQPQGSSQCRRGALDSGPVWRRRWPD